jgi:hypothetical protein
VRSLAAVEVSPTPGRSRGQATGEEAALAEEALWILYQRKALREETGTDEEHYLAAALAPRPAGQRNARLNWPSHRG